MTGPPLGVTLDQEMLERAGAEIASAVICDDDLPIRSGKDVSAELGGRNLVRYMLEHQIGEFVAGSAICHCVTPTPLPRRDLGPVLALPRVNRRRAYALLIDPALVEAIQGPRWVRGGSGIEYLLPTGFPKSALVVRPWEIQVP